MINLEAFLNTVSAQPNAEPLAAILGRSIDVGSMGPYPLSSAISLQGTVADLPFETGELRIEFSAITVGSVAVTDVKTDLDGTVGTLIFTLAPMQLSGRYTLSALEQPYIDIDTGGSLMSLEALGAPSDPATISEKQYDQLNQANNQREKLKQTANGQALVASYQTYNDNYNTVYQTNGALRNYWKAGGATSQMADHTSQAVSDGTTPVNPDGSKYGTQQVSYNKNSGQQSAFLMSACFGAGLSQAAAHIPSFQTSVVNNTVPIDDKPKNVDNIAPITADGVFKAVNAAPAAATVELAAHIDSLAQTMHRVAKREHTDDDLDFATMHFTEMTDDVVAAMQEIYAEGQRQNAPAHKVDLWQGDVACEIAATTFTFRLVDHCQGAIATTLTRQNLMINKLSVEDQTWGGDAGAIARKRVNNSLFIYGLISSKISNILEHALATHITATVTSDVE